MFAKPNLINNELAKCQHSISLEPYNCRDSALSFLLILLPVLANVSDAKLIGREVLHALLTKLTMSTSSEATSTPQNHCLITPEINSKASFQVEDSKNLVQASCWSITRSWLNRKIRSPTSHDCTIDWLVRLIMRTWFYTRTSSHGD